MSERKAKRRPDQPDNITIKHEGTRLTLAQQQPTCLRRVVNFGMVLLAFGAGIVGLVAFTVGALLYAAGSVVVGILAIYTLLNWGMSTRYFKVDDRQFSYDYNDDTLRLPAKAIRGFDIRPMEFDFGIFVELANGQVERITDGLILADAKFIVRVLEEELDIEAPSRLMDGADADDDDDMFAWADEQEQFFDES
ncbi:MAG: hypothetical protein AAFR81_12820 [Chloroflexota bacterium]